MFRIGDFSRLTRVSVKMLRHYDERGLFRPSYVDPATNYRYYSADQLPRLNRLIALKELGFTLEQIGALLDEQLAPGEIRGLLKLRRAEIEQQLHREKARLAQVENRLRAMEQEGQEPAYDVVVREVPPQLMATVRRVVTPDGEEIAACFDEAEAHAARYHARAASSPLMIFHDRDYHEGNQDIEVGVPLTHEIPESQLVRVRVVPGATMACVVYTGSYDRMEEVLRALLLWIEANAYAVSGELRELYLRFNADHAEELGLPASYLTGEPALFVSEIQLPIHPERNV